MIHKSNHTKQEHNESKFNDVSQRGISQNNKLWSTAVILICALIALVYGTTSCKEAKAKDGDNAQKVVSTELIRTSQSWDGVELPDYLQGRPEIVGIKYEIPAGQKLGMHFHPVMNFGILVQGELTIISQDGKEKVVHEGEAVVEMVKTVHHGENRGKKPVVLYMFYLSQKDLPLAVQQQGIHWRKQHEQKTHHLYTHTCHRPTTAVTVGR